MPRIESEEEKVVFEPRKAAREARRAGEPEDFVTFNPAGVPGGVELPEDSSMLAQVRRRNGSHLLFATDRSFVEERGSFFPIPYEEIADAHWMRPDYEEGSFGSILGLKREVGDQIVLELSDGDSVEISGLGWAFQALWNFLGWMLHGKRQAGQEDVSLP